MKETVNVAIQLKSDKLREEVQAENQDFLNSLDSNMNKIIKEQTSYAVASSLSELELKKILMDKMEENKSIDRSDIQKNLYNALVEAYKSDKDLIYGKEAESSKEPTHKESRTTSSSKRASRSQPTDLEDPSHQEFNTGDDDVTPAREVQDERQWYPSNSLTPDRKWHQTKIVTDQPPQPWINQLAQAAGTQSSFDELMATPIDFSAFLMNRLKIDYLTQEVLTGPTYDLMKGSCKSVAELEYHLEEVFKATNDQLDWNNPKGTPYPHDLSKPLPLILNRRGRQVIPFDHFINNDLEYLKGGSLSQRYTTSITKTKAADYGHIKWIKDKVPRSIWSTVPVVYDKHVYWGTYHWGPKCQRFYGYATNMENSKDVYSKHRIIAVTSLKIMVFYGYSHLEEIIVRRQDDQLYKFREGDFKRLRRQDIEDMLLLLVQGKLTKLSLDERYALNVALRMYTRRIVIQERVEDLQLAVESYQKKINISRPDSYRSDLRKITPYTAYSDIQGIIYEDGMNINRLMRTDKLHKFSDGTLNHVCTTLNDIATGIQMEYLPKRRWTQQDKRRAHVMINAIDKKLRDRRLMRSLEKFVVEDLTGETFVMDPVMLCTTLPSHSRSLNRLLFHFSQRFMHFYRLSHSELVGIEKVALSSSLRSLKLNVHYRLTKTSSKTDVKENLFIPASIDYDHEMIPKSKDWVERHNPDIKLPNFNIGRILVLESQAVNESLGLTKAPTDPESSIESGSEPQTPLPPLKLFKELCQALSDTHEGSLLVDPHGFEGTYKDGHGDYDHEMIPKSKDWVERHNPDIKLPNFNTGRILVPESQAVNESLRLTKAPTGPESSIESGSEPQTSLPPLKLFKELCQDLRILYCMKCKGEDHRTSDHKVYVASLKNSENYKAPPYQYASPLKQILKSKVNPFPPCTHFGFNDLYLDDCRMSPKSEICGMTHMRDPFWYLDSGCSRSMTGVKSYLYKYVEQPSPKCNTPKIESQRNGNIGVLRQSTTIKDPLRCKAIESLTVIHKRPISSEFQNINKPSKQNKVLCLHSLVYSKDIPCSACDKGKHHRASFKSKQNLSIMKWLHLLHMDLFGPDPILTDLKVTPTTPGARKTTPNSSALRFIANYFRYSDTERLSRSDEVLKLKNFKKDATLKLSKSTNQEWYEHVGPEVTRSQDDKVLDMMTHMRDPFWYLDSGCSRSMTGVKSYLYKYVEQPGPKFDDKKEIIFNANKEIVVIAPRRNDVYVLDMSSLTLNGARFFAKAIESVDWMVKETDFQLDSQDFINHHAHNTRPTNKRQHESSKYIFQDSATHDTEPFFEVNEVLKLKELRERYIITAFKSTNQECDTHEGSLLVPRQWMLKEYDWCQELSCKIFRAKTGPKDPLRCKAIESLTVIHKRPISSEFQNINKLVKQNKVLGLHSLVYSKDIPCSACDKGKHHRASFKSKQNLSIMKWLHLLHMDLFGPNIRVNSFTMKMEILLEPASNKLMVEHAEFDESNANVLERFYTSAGNHVKEILLKLNLLDHRIRKDGGEDFRYSDTERLSRSDEVLNVKNFKKDATLKLSKSTNQEWYEHVGPDVTRSQDVKVTRWRNEIMLG
ncbi:hypothetical protein Tco_1006656 [Tanacetum coccineum]|uniref:Uncharacterized protein n=1 Tax=Tanacetum coccineum TaxID=301880 RepID=A0ABQ5FJP2_9ASTR